MCEQGSKVPVSTGQKPIGNAAITTPRKKPDAQNTNPQGVMEGGGAWDIPTSGDPRRDLLTPDVVYNGERSPGDWMRFTDVPDPYDLQIMQDDDDHASYPSSFPLLHNQNVNQQQQVQKQGHTAMLKEQQNLAVNHQQAQQQQQQVQQQQQKQREAAEAAHLQEQQRQQHLVIQNIVQQQMEVSQQSDQQQQHPHQNLPKFAAPQEAPQLVAQSQAALLDQLQPILPRFDRPKGETIEREKKIDEVMVKAAKRIDRGESDCDTLAELVDMLHQERTEKESVYERYKCVRPHFDIHSFT